MTAERTDIVAALEGRLATTIPDGVVSVVPGKILVVTVRADKVSQVCDYLKTTPGLEFNYLANLTAVDRLDCFEVVYHLYSLRLGHSLVVKAQVDRDRPWVPSVTGVWRGADYQEREAYDMFGITFAGHPDLRRILLYDEFEGYPLRKDFGLPAWLPG